MASKIFAAEEKLTTHYEEIQNKYCIIPTIYDKSKENPENYAIIQKYLVALSKVFEVRSKDFRNIKNCLLL